MRPNSFLLLLLLSLIPPSCALTEYIGDNVTIVATSVEPCHLFGDSDILGKGVRYSFYISWAVGLLGFLLGALEEMKAPRLSFNILILTLTIVLIRNTSRGSFALLEWYIVMGLAFVSAHALFTVPMQPFEFAILEESESHSQSSDNSSRHISPSRNNNAAERRESVQWEDQTSNQEVATNGDTRPSLKTSRDLAEEQKRQEAEVRVNSPWVGFYTDPLGFGSLFLFYGVINCCLPWLYFIEPTSGRKEGCPVPIFLFGTWDMFNEHWQRFLKATAVIGVLVGALCFLIGFFMVYRGIEMRETYALTLELIKEGRYSGIKLLSLDASNLKRALGEGETATVPEARIAIQQLAAAIQWARGREEAAPADEEQAENLVKRASEFQEQYWAQRLLRLAIRTILFVILAVTGSLSIWFIEKTIDKNHIDMDDDLGSSNGQLLALLVAVLTTANFLWEIFKSRDKEQKARKDAEKMVKNIFDDARSLQPHAGQQKGTWKSIADKASSAWRFHLSEVPPSSPSAAIKARGGRSVLGFDFRTWPRDRGGDNEV